MRFLRSQSKWQERIMMLLMRNDPGELTLLTVQRRHGTTDAYLMSTWAKRKNYTLHLLTCRRLLTCGVLWWAMCSSRMACQSCAAYVEECKKLCTLHEALMVKVGVYQGSVLSSLLFIMVFDALSHEFRSGCP